MGAVVAADACGLSLSGSAIVALAIVIALSFRDADVRRCPTIILHTLCRSGGAFGALLLAAGTLGMILAVLERTGLPFDLAQILVAVVGEAWLSLILLSAVIAFAFALATPGLAACLITEVLLDSSLRTVGLSDLAIHLPILFLCAGMSAIITLRSQSDTGT